MGSGNIRTFTAPEIIALFRSVITFDSYCFGNIETVIVSDSHGSAITVQ